MKLGFVGWWWIGLVIGWWWVWTLVDAK